MKLNSQWSVLFSLTCVFSCLPQYFQLLKPIFSRTSCISESNRGPGIIARLSLILDQPGRLPSFLEPRTIKEMHWNYYWHINLYTLSIQAWKSTTHELDMSTPRYDDAHCRSLGRSKFFSGSGLYCVMIHCTSYSWLPNSDRKIELSTHCCQPDQHDLNCTAIGRHGLIWNSSNFRIPISALIPCPTPWLTAVTEKHQTIP